MYIQKQKAQQREDLVRFKLINNSYDASFSSIHLGNKKDKVFFLIF